MRFTAQEEYGLRCMLQIARDPAGLLTIPEIAAREGLTQAHVAKIMRVLRRAGLVESTRGQKGGYQLSAPADRTSVATVLAALGSRLYSRGFCGRFSGHEAECVHNIDCSIRSIWAALDDLVQRALTRTTLTDLLAHTEGGMGSLIESQIGAHVPVSVGLWPR